MKNHPVYFRYTNSYLIPNSVAEVKFSISEDEPIPLNNNEWVRFWVSQANFWGNQRGYLCISIEFADFSSLTGSLFNAEIPLDKGSQKSLDEVVLAQRKLLTTRPDDLLRLFRWLTGLPFELKNKRQLIPFQWSIDQINWVDVPFDNQAQGVLFDIVGGHPTETVNRDLIESLIVPNLHLAEPLGHDLLIEAYRLRESNDLRGAFTIGYSALEVGVKEYVQKRIPETKWLMEKSPSPDMLKMCSQYLPSLDRRLDIKDTLEKRLIRKYMESRNTLVHEGKFEESDQTVIKKLCMVEYMLHRFDYCLGLDRALLYVEKAKYRMDHLGIEDLPKE
ncbi:hypothetical protein [Spirosoma oryzicola]|uniref:hypothetical protein n=1 Tax=Spirosoma oryzicola TaxID=2898794 RepID=UPI001E5D12A3|nr:hypothetical protein [Spirosoma oryzicola]UHG93188.1 hypothetical protein LQ777_09875 [Spirosoma oryzicola]